MTPAETRLWQLAHRKVAGMTPEVAAAVLRSFAIIRDSLSESDLARMIDNGQIGLLISEVFSEQAMDRAFIPFRQRIRDATQQSFRYTVPSLPRGGKVDGVLAVSFDHLSSHVVDAIRSLETKAVTGLATDIQDTVKAYVENGIRDGVNPRTIARNIRPIVGMSPTQSENALKYEAKLTEQGLNASKVASRVATYQRKAVSVNAATIARTATLDAFKEGQNLAWQDAIDRGVVDGDRLQKVWVGIMDDRERPEHVAMEGETVPFSDPFSNSEYVPGSSTFNCRCLARYFVA